VIRPSGLLLIAITAIWEPAFFGREAERRVDEQEKSRHCLEHGSFVMHRAPGDAVQIARKDNGNPVEVAAVAAAFVLPGHGTLVIMEACKQSLRQRAALTACAVLPLPGIGG
jgi:hypothetical protein